MRYFIRLAYNGSDFHGWQIQPNAVSVQSTIEDALSILLRCKTPITGAGRTDAGVNAHEMFAHFDTDMPIADKSRFILSLNRLCGKKIAIYDIYDVADDSHARFDAVLRTYKYFVSFRKDPFLYPFSWFSPRRLDMEMMNRMAEILLHTDDFTSFAKLHSDAKTNICRVSEAFWQPLGEHGAVFTISADRFLRNMVRAVVGTLVDVGRGNLSEKDFIGIIKKKDRCAAGQSMPAEALFLWSVRYPYIPAAEDPLINEVV